MPAQKMVRPLPAVERHEVELLLVARISSILAKWSGPKWKSPREMDWVFLLDCFHQVLGIIDRGIGFHDDKVISLTSLAM